MASLKRPIDHVNSAEPQRFDDSELAGPAWAQSDFDSFYQYATTVIRFPLSSLRYSNRDNIESHDNDIPSSLPYLTHSQDTIDPDSQDSEQDAARKDVCYGMVSFYWP
jgi:hypothetical protein